MENALSSGSLWNQPKSDLTGSVTAVTAKDFQREY